MTKNKEEEKETKNKSNSKIHRVYKGLVVQPFGVKKVGEEETDFDAIFESLTPLEKIKPSMPIMLKRADIVDVTAEDLREHVHRLLKKYDFFIADVTGNNPNVLYEIGFAVGLGKDEQIILITQNPEEIPVNLEGLIRVRYKRDALEGLPIDIKQHLLRIKESIDRVEATVKTSEHYTVEAYATRLVADFNKMFENAKDKIDILQTNLVTIEANHLNVLKNAMEENKNLRIRILTLDPQSQYVGARAMQLGFRDIGVFRAELSASLDLVRVQFAGSNGRVQIRKYDEFPLQITYIIDNRVVSSVISATGRSRENCAFIIDKNRKGIEHSFVDHFEKLWNNEEKTITVLE